MKEKRRYISILLLTVNLLMLIVTLIPHHHHFDGTICMKQDIPAEQQCPTQHRPQHDTCCNDECMTRFHSPSPNLQNTYGPVYLFVATLFTDTIIEHLLKPQERRFRNYYIYREALHDANHAQTFSLRAPPSLA